MARFIWTEKLLIEAAAKYESKTEFKSAHPSGYAAARRMGLLNLVCAHMKAKIKPPGYWQKIENLKSEARKYRTRSDFAMQSQGAYTIAKRLGVLDEICGHMSLQGNRYFRAIYVFEFENNMAYVGLSYNVEKRKQAHLNSNGPVGRTAKYYNFAFKQLTEYLPRKKARHLEGAFLKTYLDNGWQILNTAKTGGLGSGDKITTEDIKAEIAKYKYLKDFAANSPSIYATAKNRRLHGLFSHLKRVKTPDGTYSKAYCRKLAKKCGSRAEFKKAFPSAYSICVKKGWMGSICKHMKRPLPHNFKYNYDRCASEAAKCTNATQFKMRYPGSFNAAHKNGWYKRITRHFARLIKTPAGWNFDKCLKKAKRFSSKANFRKSEYNAYKYACRHKFLDKIERQLGWSKRNEK